MALQESPTTKVCNETSTSLEATRVPPTNPIAAPSTTLEVVPVEVPWNVALRRHCLRHGSLACSVSSVLAVSEPSIRVAQPVSSIVTWDESNTKSNHASLVSRIAQVLASAGAHVSTEVPAVAPATTKNSWTHLAARTAHVLWTPVQVSHSLLHALVDRVVGAPDYSTADDGNDEIEHARSAAHWTDLLNDPAFVEPLQDEAMARLLAPHKGPTAQADQVAVDVGLAAASVKYVDYVLRTAMAPTVMAASDVVPWLVQHVQPPHAAVTKQGDNDDDVTMPILTPTILSSFLARLPLTDWNVILDAVSSSSNGLQRVVDTNDSVLYVIGPAEHPHFTPDVRVAMYHVQRCLDQHEASIGEATRQAHALSRQALALTPVTAAHRSHVTRLLQRRQRYLQHVETTRDTILTLEGTLHAIYTAADQQVTVALLQSTATTLSSLVAFSPTRVQDDVRDEMDELQLVSDTLWVENSTSVPVDDDALWQELLQLESFEPEVESGTEPNVEAAAHVNEEPVEAPMATPEPTQAPGNELSLAASDAVPSLTTSTDSQDAAPAERWAVLE